MLGFVAIMMAEAGSKTPALESFGGDVLGVVLLSITLTLATIFPKFASGSSLKVRARGGGLRRAAAHAAPQAPARPDSLPPAASRHAPPPRPPALPPAPQDLHAAATGPNLKSEGVIGSLMGFFDTNTELWSGRLAMIGILGTIIVEAVTGNSLL